MRQSEQIGELIKALCEFQYTVPPLVKDGKSFTNEYVTLDNVFATIKEKIHEARITILQGVETIDGKDCLTTRLQKDEQFIECTMVLPAVSLSKANGAQAIGAGISYMRRYALVSLLGLACGDDVDGNVNTHPATATAADKKQFLSSPKENKPAVKKSIPKNEKKSEISEQKPAPAPAKDKPVELAGGPSTVAQKDKFVKLISWLDPEGNKVFSPEEVRAFKAMRVTSTADDVNKMIEDKLHERYGDFVV